MESHTELTADVYFLIQRFLSSGPLKKTLKLLNEELEEYKILPRRLDWEGNEHERTVDDMERQFPNIRPDYLLQLCYRATNSAEKAISLNKNITSFLSFKPKVLNSNRVLYNFNQFCNYVIRHHGAASNSFNIVNMFRGREISGPQPRKHSAPTNVYGSIQIQRVTLGHLSAVYCILFDQSGNYIVTGADDLLIKLWSAHTGRLIASFRGASSEITDIAINVENTLLAAGSIDRILRVWSLQTGVPIAVLTGHTGMITSVNFCPTSCWGIRYLITTSSDGSVAFWTYTHDAGKADFRLKPIMYQEKVRPGQAQMICSSFSRGGTFLATGSVDHHVRVYYMKGDDGPQRILENETHRDRVDSIQWAHSGLRLVSGSKDGTAIIWWFETQQWKTMVLNMTTRLVSSTVKKNAEDAIKKVKVTMVTWDLTDRHVITAASDHTIKVWNSATGQLDKVLTGHRDEVYVMESHPHDSNVILSAGHDGQLFVWDIFRGEIIARYLNTIEGQGYGAIFDVKWSPDGCTIAATDSHGHLLTFGFGTGSPFYEQLPKELFFHTDYRPLVRDANHYVLDEQTQLAPHLMPPPFLVDMDGNPYPPMFQRLVPGREMCNVEQLVPNIVIGNEGTQEVIQDISDAPRQNSEENHIRGNSAFRTGRNRNRDIERIRQSTGDWQTDPNMEWKRHTLVQPLRKSTLHEAKELIEEICKAEIDEYLKQLRQRPHMICTSAPNTVQKEKKEKKVKNNTKYQTRSTRLYVLKPDISESSELSESSGYSDWMAEEGVNLQPPKRSKRRQVIQNSISDDDDDDDDDEEEDEEDEEDDDDEDDDEHVEVKVDRERKRRDRTEVPKITATVSSSSTNHTTNNSVPSTSAATNQPRRTNSKLKISEKYRLSEWLTETRPRKSPYYPQMGDEIVYFMQGHQLYLDAVRVKNIYEICAKDLPWSKLTIKDIEFVKVIGIQYEIRPPRLCCLKLAMLDEEGRLTGEIFTVKYHDMPDVLDFFVLKQTYTISVSRNWLPNEKFRCMIDDEWWFGEIIENTPHSNRFPNSPFLCFDIKWNNGEGERMSPWDMEPVDEERLPEDENKALPVLEQELASILYKTVPEDWPGTERETASKFILAGMTKVMELAIAEPFLVPVDLSIYPSYAMIIEYPIDLSTIKARFENSFYRRLTAAQFDIRYLATNAEKFNERHSIIVKHARILTELCLRIVKQCTDYIDVQPLYHQLVDTYDSSNTEDEIEIMPTSSRSLRSLPSRHFKNSNDWKLEAKNLIDGIWNCEDSVPFRAPVNSVKYPDYHLVVKNPMDLGTVRENLTNEKYENPNQFANDLRLIFQNSRTYNTNNRSRIYVMTVRLAANFEEHINKIIYNWKIAKRRELRGRNSGSSQSHTSNESSSSNEGDDNSIKLATNAKKHIVADNTETDDEDDDLPLTSLKSMNKLGTESDNSDKMKPTTSSTRQQSTDNDSEDSYKPVIGYRRNNRRKRGNEESSESENDDYVEEEDEVSSEESGDGEGYQATRRSARRRPVRRKVQEEESENTSDSDDLLSNIRAKKRRRYLPVESDEEEEEIDVEEGEDSGDERVMRNGRDSKYFTTVSSRGRVRKLTPRVQALMRKDKKLL